MYIDGENAYLNDLDWVKIVKSLRELRALSRVILNQNQLQILAFESKSVLPSNNVLKKQELDFIQEKVPFEYDARSAHSDYANQITKFIDQLPPLAKIDSKILAEISYNSSYAPSVNSRPTKTINPKLSRMLSPQKS